MKHGSSLDDLAQRGFLVYNTNTLCFVDFHEEYEGVYKGYKRRRFTFYLYNICNQIRLKGEGLVDMFEIAILDST
jgi:hypothetical protein